jgi:hypothetical protein
MIFVLSFRHLGGRALTRVNKAEKNPPSTTIPALFLRELRVEVRENVGQFEDAYRAKDNLCFDRSPARLLTRTVRLRNRP